MSRVRWDGGDSSGGDKVDVPVNFTEYKKRRAGRPHKTIEGRKVEEKPFPVIGPGFTSERKAKVTENLSKLDNETRPLAGGSSGYSAGVNDGIGGGGGGNPAHRVRFIETDEDRQKGRLTVQKARGIIRNWVKHGVLYKDELIVTDEIRDLVSDMLYSGATHKQIAAVLMVTIDMMYKHFGYELTNAVVIQNAVLTNCTLAMARYIPIMNIFAQKSRGGWQDTTNEQAATSNNVAVVVHIGGPDANL